MLTDFQNSFTDGLISKCTIKSLFNISPHRNRVAALPCEISVLNIAMLNDCVQQTVLSHSKKVVEKYLLV